jgi:pyridoxal phosphate enzyme (YggS family)
MDAIGINLQAVRGRIARAAATSGRHAEDIQLVAVSKTFDAQCVAAAYACGQSAFGENYAQEAIEKISTLRNLRLQWHYLGPLQSNKTRQVAEHFDWVHSIDRLKIAERLSAARPAALGSLQICLQVNLGDEPTKGGVAPDDAIGLARTLSGLPRIKLRGLMAIPPAVQEFAQQRRYFAQLRQLKEKISATGLVLDTLSMGMSADLEAAIAEGATLVRVGTAIFGHRQQAPEMGNE